MNELDYIERPSEVVSSDENEIERLAPREPIIIDPPILRASGLYQWQTQVVRPGQPPRLPPADTVREELRLDVDGRYPLMVASGTRVFGLGTVVDWVANVNRLLTLRWPTWSGTIWYKNGNTTLPQTNVRIVVSRSTTTGQLIATVLFTGGGAPSQVVVYDYKSPYYRAIDRVTLLPAKMEFEFDSAEGEAPTLDVDTCAHPNRPAALPCENLTIATVFQRAGFDSSVSPGISNVPLAGAGPNALWSDQEMHDAMMVYWSRFANYPQWAVWVFFASLHEMGTNLGGIMFDQIGGQDRQGCAIFNDSFIATPPAGDPDPAAWVRRNLFWTACHETGHCFNLAHSWQKSLGTPWIPLANEPEARSFMNYPQRVSGGQSAFFANFEYRFSPQELLFLRHAPYQFVQPGYAAWFDHHGFEGANVAPYPDLRLEARVNRDAAVFEFMEPVTIELKLTNISDQPQLVEEALLARGEEMFVILKKDGMPARQFIPFARRCWRPSKKALMPGESLYESLFVSAGNNGWDLAEPGRYTIQIALHKDGEDIISNPLRIRVKPPRDHNEENLAQDFFTEDVGRIIAFDGSRVLDRGIGVLREVVDQFRDRRVSLHAQVALGSALMRESKRLVPDDPNQPIRKVAARPDEANWLLASGLTGNMPAALESLGHIDFKWYADRYTDWLALDGGREEAAKVQDAVLAAMSERDVQGRGILGRVLEDVKLRRDSYRGKR